MLSTGPPPGHAGAGGPLFNAPPGRDAGSGEDAAAREESALAAAYQRTLDEEEGGESDGSYHPSEEEGGGGGGGGGAAEEEEGGGGGGGGTGRTVQCGTCGLFGHNARTCAARRNIFGAGGGSGGAGAGNGGGAGGGAGGRAGDGDGAGYGGGAGDGGAAGNGGGAGGGADDGGSAGNGGGLSALRARYEAERARAAGRQSLAAEMAGVAGSAGFDAAQAAEVAGAAGAVGPDAQALQAEQAVMLAREALSQAEARQAQQTLASQMRALALAQWPQPPPAPPAAPPGLGFLPPSAQPPHRAPPLQQQQPRLLQQRPPQPHPPPLRSADWGSHPWQMPIGGGAAAAPAAEPAHQHQRQQHRPAHFGDQQQQYPPPPARDQWQQQQRQHSVNSQYFDQRTVEAVQQRVDQATATTGKGLRELATWMLLGCDYNADGDALVRSLTRAVAGRNGAPGALRPDPALLKALASGQGRFLALPLQHYAAVSQSGAGPLSGELVVEAHRHAKVANKVVKFTLKAAKTTDVGKESSLIYAAQMWDRLMSVCAPLESGKMMKLILHVLAEDAFRLSGSSAKNAGLPPLWAHALHVANLHIEAWGHNLSVATAAVVAPVDSPDALWPGALDATSAFHRLHVAPTSGATGGAAAGGY